MTWHFLFWILPFLIHADIEKAGGEKLISLSPQTSPEIAPLIPLEPQFPLGLTEANRQLFVDNPERLKEVGRSIQRDLEMHSFPWLAIMSILGCGGLGWAIYLMRDHWPQHLAKAAIPPSTREQIEQALQALGKRSLESSQIQIYFIELGSIFLEALQTHLGLKTMKLTTNELAEAIKKQPALSGQQTAEALSILAEIDQVKFAGKSPSQEEAKHIFLQIKNFIELNLLR